MRKTAAQRAIELKERDLRVLVRSLQRWGDIRLCYTEIVSIVCAISFSKATHPSLHEQCKEAKLEDKNRSIILDTCDDIIETCEEDLRLHCEARARAANEGATGPKSKAVLVSFCNVSGINMETVVSRFHELRILITSCPTWITR